MTQNTEYSEMKKLLDDDEINKIAEPIFSYLKATISIRNKNIDCTVDITNSSGYTSHEPQYVYPWGFSQILLNCPQIEFSDLIYFISAFSSYFQIKSIEKFYAWISTKGNPNQSTHIEKWIAAPENSSFIKLIQQWDIKKDLLIKFPETVTIHDAFRWYLCLSLLEQSKNLPPQIEFDKLISKLTEKNHIPKEFMDFEERSLTSYRTTTVNEIQPVKGERLLYILGKCTLLDDSYRFYGLHSVLLDPIVAVELNKNITVSADEIKSSMISDYAKYLKHDFRLFQFLY